MPALLLLSESRRARGMTQADLAHAAGVSVPTIRGLERGSGSLRSLVGVMAVLDLAWGWTRADENAAVDLARRRLDKGLSQAEVARRAGCSRPCVIALERDLTGSLSILLAVLSVLGFRRALRARSPKARGLVPVTNAPARDCVMTPPALAKAVIAHFSDRMEGSVLDPAKGGGAFFDAFPPHLDRHWCEIADGRDFHHWTTKVDWIMTNPPWSRLRDFTRHAMTLAANIVWVAPMVNVTTRARLRDLDEQGYGIAELVLLDTPPTWPQSGFQLVAVHIARGHRDGWLVSRLDAVAGATGAGQRACADQPSCEVKTPAHPNPLLAEAREPDRFPA